MDTIIQEQIAKQALADHGWKVNEVRIDEVERLRRPSCSFYTAGPTVRPLAYQANYALVGGKLVIGTGDGAVVAQILDTCSDHAGADWLAEIVTRFHGDLGAGVVLRDEMTRPDVTRKLKAVGETFTAPTVDEKRSTIKFLLLNPETNVVYRIVARRAPGGPVEVVKTRLLPTSH